MYKNVICAPVLYWCETWSVILREEECLRVFDKRDKEVVLHNDAASC